MEVENALLGHPHIAEAAVVGATDERGLSYSVAHVVLRGNVQGSEKLAAEICEHVQARLVSYKVPREMRFCSEHPKTVTGKIQHFKLRTASISIFMICARAHLLSDCSPAPLSLSME